MKYMVIGSNSFSASHLIDKLLDEPNNYVVGVSRSPEKDDLYLPYKRHNSENFVFGQVDIRNTKEVIKYMDIYKPDCVVNYAAQSEVFQSFIDPENYFDVNTVAVINLCNALRNRSYIKKYVHISTCEVYGTTLGKYDGREKPSMHLRPTTPYAVSKAAADMFLMTQFKHFGFPIIIIRSTSVYGKHQQLYKIIPRTIIKILQGKKIELHENAGPRSFVHIRDVVDGIIRAINVGEAGKIYHFSLRADLKNGIFGEATVRCSVQKICEMMDVNFDEAVKFVKGRQEQDYQYLLDYTESEKELDWYPKIKFEEGVKEVIMWIRDNWDRIKKEEHNYIHKI